MTAEPPEWTVPLLRSLGCGWYSDPYPLLVLETFQHPSIPRSRSLIVYFALLIQFPNSGGACCGPSKSEVKVVMKVKGNAGFSLVELMVTTAVVVVLLSTGVPAFSALIKNNRLETEDYALRTILSAARSEAQTQRTTVTVCRSDNGIDCSSGNWGNGYISFIDLDTDGQLDSAEQLLEHRSQNIHGITVSYSQAENMLRFDGNGSAVGSSGTFTFCDTQPEIEPRGLVVSVVGSLREAVASKNGDATSIPQDHDGNKLSCQRSP